MARDNVSERGTPMRTSFPEATTLCRRQAARRSPRAHPGMPQESKRRRGLVYYRKAGEAPARFKPGGFRVADEEHQSAHINQMPSVRPRGLGIMVQGGLHGATPLRTRWPSTRDEYPAMALHLVFEGKELWGPRADQTRQDSRCDEFERIRRSGVVMGRMSRAEL